MKGVGALDNVSPLRRMLFRLAYLFICAIGFASIFATIVVSLAKVGSGDYLYSGDVWAQIFAIQIVHALIWMFGHMIIAIGIAIDFVAIPFGLLLISNIIGGFSMDFATQSYYNFYQIFPFNWSIQLMRHCLYGSYSTFLVSRAVGALLGEFFFFFFLFIYICIRKEGGFKNFMGSNTDLETTNYSSVEIDKVQA